MTARSLLNSLPARNMKRAIGEHKKLSIVMMILQILGIPMAAGALMLDMILESMSEKSQYYKQLYYYQEALEQITGHKVKERRIYSFALHEDILVKERQE